MCTFTHFQTIFSGKYVFAGFAAASAAAAAADVCFVIIMSVDWLKAANDCCCSLPFLPGCEKEMRKREKKERRKRTRVGRFWFAWKKFANKIPSLLVATSENKWAASLGKSERWFEASIRMRQTTLLKNKNQRLICYKLKLQKTLQFSLLI